MDDTYNHNRRVLSEARRTNANRFNDSSKRRLTKNIEKKFKTTMIGSLAKFEDAFGELWGHGKLEDELTNEELYWHDKWEEVRTEILNNGNNQLRAAIDEMAEYTLTWNRHKTDFIIKQQ